jgi:excisionase family DNA binding protein
MTGGTTLLTIPEAAARLRVSVPTLRRYIARRRLAVVRLVGAPRSPIRIRTVDLDAFIADCVVPAAVPGKARAVTRLIQSRPERRA